MEMHPFPVFSGVESVERTVRGQTRGVKTIDQRSEPITIENTRKRAFGLRRGKWKQSQSAGKGAMLTCPPPPPHPPEILFEINAFRSQSAPDAF